MRNIITFGGKSLSDFDMYNNGRSTYNAPAKDYTMIKIIGRSGDLVYDNKRFENYDLTYPDCWIEEDFDSNIEGLRAYLMSRNGYQRLEDTYHPNEYRMAVCKNAMDVDVDMYNKFGSFDLVFNCKPQRFLKSGELSTEFTTAGTIENPTLFNSEPLIRVYATRNSVSNLSIGVQSLTITMPSNKNYIDIDCALKEVYNESLSLNSSVTLSNYKFPVLTPGNNGISFDATISKVVITPRWWTL